MVLSAETVIQDAESYQRLPQLKERTEVSKTLRQRLAKRNTRKRQLGEDFFTEFFAKNKIEDGRDPLR